MLGGKLANIATFSELANASVATFSELEGLGNRCPETGGFFYQLFSSNLLKMIILSKTMLG